MQILDQISVGLWAAQRARAVSCEQVDGSP